MNFSDMNLEIKEESTKIQVLNSKTDETINLEVRDYLPIDEKVQLIQFVVSNAVDDMTGCFSPVRTEIFSMIAICRWYAGIVFDEELSEVGVMYDKLETNGIINAIISAIPEDEYTFINQLITETCKDIARYNNSFMGMMKFASENTSSLDSEVRDILEKIKDNEGMEQLSTIKDIVG